MHYPTLTNERPSLDERVATRRDRLAGIITGERAAGDTLAVELDGFFDPELEALLRTGMGVEAAVAELVGADPILADDDDDLIGSGLLDDQTLAITAVSEGGPGYLAA